jgi:hypothetical protein
MYNRNCIALGIVIVLAVLLLVVAGTSGKAHPPSLKMPPSIQDSAAEPIKYVGGVICDKHYYDGRLRHAVGVHSCQAMRSNRTKPPEGGVVGWTYNHGPNLAYWKGRFYLQCLSQLKEEYVPPGSSTDVIPSVLYSEYGTVVYYNH